MSVQTPVGQVAVFRVFPERERSRLFYRVRIFRSCATLRSYIRQSHIRTPLGHFGRAMCSTWAEVYFPGKNRPGRTRPVMGEILLVKGWVGTEVISHECTHAAFGWSRRIGLRVSFESASGRCSDDEERFCYGLGQMASQIGSQVWMRGLVEGRTQNA